MSYVNKQKKARLASEARFEEELVQERHKREMDQGAVLAVIQHKVSYSDIISNYITSIIISRTPIS